jgi:leader peptidase (prepilin peptidase)/N-methyltransferase
LPDWLIPILAAPFIGSFLGVLIRRLPIGERIALSRSHCESCEHTLSARDLVPLGSYILAGGKCRYCAAPIGAFHPAVELAALAVAIWAASLDAGFHLWADCLLGWALLALGWIDARHMVLPDMLTLPLVLAGLAVAYVMDPAGTAHHAAGAAIGWLLFWGLSRVYRALRGRDGLGEGDAKLLAASGAWVAWYGLGSVMLLGAVIGLGVWLAMRLAGGKVQAGTLIPFGPALALATWLVWLYGPLTL